MRSGSVWQALEAVGVGNAALAETICSGYYRDNLDKLRERLTIAHRDRKDLLEEAFKCHEQGLYFASTCLFVSQADGLGKGKLLSKAKVKDYMKAQKSPQIAVTVLESTSAISADDKDKSKFFSDLNRHEVMHGLYSGYGTELNSLKALSLLSFVCDFVGRYNEGTPGRSQLPR